VVLSVLEHLHLASTIVVEVVEDGKVWQDLGVDEAKLESRRHGAHVLRHRSSHESLSAEEQTNRSEVALDRPRGNILDGDVSEEASITGKSVNVGVGDTIVDHRVAEKARRGGG